MVTELKCNYNNLSSLSSFPRIGFSCELTVYQTNTFPVVCALFGNHLAGRLRVLKWARFVLRIVIIFVFLIFIFIFIFGVDFRSYADWFAAS